MVAMGATIALILSALNQGWDGSSTFLNGFIAVLAVALAAELSSVRVNLGTSTISIAFIPYLAGTFLFDPLWSMLLGGVALFSAETFFRKKPWIKAVFNTSKEILALGLAAALYGLLGGKHSVYEFELAAPAMFGAAIAYSATNSVAVSLAVSLSDGPSFRDAWVRIYGGSVLYDLFATPIPVLLAYLYVEFQLLGIVILSAPLFVVRHIYVMNLRLQQASRELLELMVKNIEARDPYTSGHSQRVSQYARIIAREAGLYPRHVEQVATSALLHDVGKVYGEYAPLLQKDGKLNPEEKELLETHPVRSAELVSTISSLHGVVEQAVRHHHENYDGTGYPDGLSGESIPIGARIIMLADTLDAMTTDRPYRRALPFDRVIEEIRRYSGKQFDPHLAELVLRSTAIRRLIAMVSPAERRLATATVEGDVEVRFERAPLRVYGKAAVERPN